MATTTNFGWETPDDTDLVKDGALAMRTLGNAIDASLVDLKGGTTGQVLSKTSNTDMDFTWVTSDDANAIQNAIVDAKGDLITATAADTPARLAVGSNGETLVADSAASTGLRWQGNYAAGKNKIINGAFDIWQRGTSFTTTNGYTADRWIGDSDATITFSRETFTAGTAPVAGYEGTYFYRQAKSAGGSYCSVRQRIEDVRVFANQTVTLSFWAKVSSGTASIEPYYIQNFGTGGSAVVQSALTTQTITTSWARYSVTFTLPSISGKTIGTNSFLEIYVTRCLTSAAVTIDTWGVQLEAGSVATAFQTATGTLQGELAAAMRYCQVANNQFGQMYSTTAARVIWPLQVSMRTTPSITYPTGTFTNFIEQVGIGNLTPTGLAVTATDNNFVYTNATGMTGGTNFNPIRYNGTAFIASAEL